MVDTALFNVDFKAMLLQAVDNLDELVDGVLVHGDNFQGLSLLQERYKEQVNCIYIDPPYNAKTSEILYKNTFKHSSWLSFIESRLFLASSLLASTSGLVVAIDENEQERLGAILSYTMPSYRKHCVSLIHNKKGIQGTDFSYCHEFAYFMLSESHKGTHDKVIAESEWEWANLRKWGSESTRDTAANCFYPIVIKNNQIVSFGAVCDERFHPTASNIKNDDGTITIYPIDPTGVERKWRYEVKTVAKIKDVLKVIVTRDGEYQIHKAKNKQQFKTIWSDNKYIAGDYGTKTVTDLGLNTGGNLFPKSIFTVLDSVYAVVGSGNGLIVDYYGGSGTTAPAVINLNRQDNGQRKYILMEQGEYFDTVLKPRIQKVVFSQDWKEGKAQANNTGNFNGISHAFKVLKIESYEDTLNNLQLTRSKGQADLLNQMQPQERSQYLMHYMLKLESKGSLLSVTDFLKPFGYQLNITTDSAGAYQTRTVDLVETFNYLLGLRVKQIDMQLDKGFVQVIGTLPNGESALIFWRDCDKINYEQLNKLLDKLHINPRDAEYDVIYVNGDHNIPTVFQSTIDEGGITRTQKIRQIEREFLDRMFG